MDVSRFVESFGVNSEVYNRSVSFLRNIWQAADVERKHYALSCWRDMQIKLYGKAITNVFFTQTYLALIAKLMRDSLLQAPIKVDSQHILSWIFTVPNAANELTKYLVSVIGDIEHKKIDRDVFKDLYENLISKSFRVRRGEYNTPDWLAELMLEKVLDTDLASSRIIDPSCGTGTFLFNIIKKLKHESSFKITNVVGIDVNPLMVEIAKTNYLLALGENQTAIANDSQIPIFCFDTLKLSEENFRMLGEFDIEIGNPPWGSLRDIKNLGYQKFVKRLAIEAGLINRKDTHLFTQIEMATVFFVHCLRFLKRGGVFAFVMPRSVIGATMQNYNFLRSNKFGFHLTEILDLRSVKPLFYMPACVLIGRKNGPQKYPVRMFKFRGLLPGFSSTFEEVKSNLVSEHALYTPEFFMLDKKSDYYDLFNVGVCIFPRSFYFVSLLKKQNGLIEIKTSDSILAKNVKRPWKISLHGFVEPEFIYYTALGWEILPYTLAGFRLVVLPVRKKANAFQLLSVKEMKEENLSGVANWFEKVEEIWQKRRTPASKDRFPSIMDRFNYGNLLTNQSPLKKFVVLYTATGRDLTSCIVDRHKLPTISFGDEYFTPSDFIADVKTWFYETNNYDEALFLCGLLNSDIINKKIKPLQPLGLGGERAIHRRPLMINIPKFNMSQKIHRQISKFASLNLKTAATLDLRKIGLRSELKENLPYAEELNDLIERMITNAG